MYNLPSVARHRLLQLVILTSVPIVDSTTTSAVTLSSDKRFVMVPYGVTRERGYVLQYVTVSLNPTALKSRDPETCQEINYGSAN